LRIFSFVVLLAGALNQGEAADCSKKITLNLAVKHFRNFTTILISNARRRNAVIFPFPETSASTRILLAKFIKLMLMTIRRNV
jgi:hypothetical protein